MVNLQLPHDDVLLMRPKYSKFAGIVKHPKLGARALNNASYNEVTCIHLGAKVMSITVLLIGVGSAAVLLILVGLAMESGSKRRRAEADAVTLNTSPREASGCTQALFLLLPVGIMLIGAAVIFIALYWWNDYQSSEEWPTAPGTITRAEVERTNKATFVIGNDDNKPRYRPYLAYTYIVNGRSYTNDDLYFSIQALFGTDISYDTHVRAQHYIGGRQTGQAVTVIYNPDDPQQAILERRIDDRYFYAGLGAGMVGAAIGLAAFVAGLLRILRGGPA